jgi:hypothetical protein
MCRVRRHTQGEIPKDSVLNYETPLKANKFLLLAHGTVDEAAHARRILQTTRPHSVETHTPAAEEAAEEAGAGA